MRGIKSIEVSLGITRKKIDPKYNIITFEVTCWEKFSGKKPWAQFWCQRGTWHTFSTHTQ